jgi:hypothetical protein
MPSQSLNRFFSRTVLPGIALVCALAANAAASTDTAHESDAEGARSRAAPEIDPGLAAAGLVLLSGGTLVLMSRRRPKSA